MSKASKYILALSCFVLTAVSTFAQNVVDSDTNNSAGSNSGKDHTGFFIAICLLLVLSVVVAYFRTGKQKDI